MAMSKRPAPLRKFHSSLDLKLLGSDRAAERNDVREILRPLATSLGGEIQTKKEKTGFSEPG
jgi:hypothetical protein